MLRVVLYEGEGAQPLEPEHRSAVVQKLLLNGYSMTYATRQGRVAPADSSELLVLGRFDGGSHPELEDGNGQVTLHFRDIDGSDADQIIETVNQVRDDAEAAEHGNWKPWFPVIDYDRCTNCMQCLSFCLFGVYGVSEDHQIQVQNNDNCKTNCPACSRVCPEAAIMFPKYKTGPINGEEVKQEDLEREKMKVDISSLLGGDIYQKLRDRSARAKSRFAKERDSDKALKERTKCLDKLAQNGDIPPEVLQSLPSQDEIQQRADDAMEKAEAARAQQKDKH